MDGVFLKQIPFSLPPLVFSENVSPSLAAHLKTWASFIGSQVESNEENGRNEIHVKLPSNTKLFKMRQPVVPANTRALMTPAAP